MDIFEITLQRRITDFWPVVVEFKQFGQPPVIEEGRLKLDSTKLAALEITPQTYGQALGESLFRELVRDLFIKSLPQGQEDRLHVWLHVEDEALRTLRWERLAAPIGREWLPLAFNQQTPFSQRSARWPGPQFLPFARRELRALIVVASPTGLDRYLLTPFDANEAATRVQHALGQIPCDVLADAGVASAAGLPTLDALVERLTRQRYPLLHLVAHAHFVAQEGETYLFLANEQGQATPVAASELIRRLRLAQGSRGLPHLAFLAACQTAVPQAEAFLGGLGQRLVRELGMPAVIAMTESVSVDTAFMLSQRFYERLAEHGRVDQALAEASSQLAGRPDILTPALFTCLEGQPLFIEARPLQASDVQYGLQQMAKLLETRAPVLLVDEQADGAEGQFTLASQAWETALTSQEGRGDGQPQPQAEATVRTLCDQAVGIAFDRLALGAPAPAYESTCPFPGLGAFRADDRRFFRGRQPLVNDLLRRSERSDLLALVGPSGCGKSSLALAGLAPQLADRQSGLRTAYLRPGGAPLAELDAALGQLAGALQPTLLIVDQFEELFTQTEDETERRAFIERLLAEAAGHLVLLTMRDEFLDDCQAHPRLYASLQSNLVYVTPMSMEELGVAMQAQANAANLAFEAGLVNTILDHIADEPGRMPLLQHGLFQLWKRRRGRWLLAEEYRATGGIQGAIAASAEAVYQRLTPQEQGLMRSILLRLVRVDESDARRDSSRRVGYADLATGMADRAAVVRLVQRLADEKLLVTSFNPARSQDEVQLAHEALIGQWGRLRAWIDTDRTQLKTQQQLAMAAAEWNRLGRDTGALLRGTALSQAEEWATAQPEALTQGERQFLEESIAAREREIQESEQKRQLELALARERAEKAEAAALDQERRSKRLRVAVVALAALLVLPMLLVITFLRQQASPWKRVLGFPTDPVSSLALGQTREPTAPWICAGTSNIGLGCSRDGARWNFYQQDLPTGAPGGLGGILPNRSRGITTLALDRTHPNRLFLSAYEAGVMRSDDAGRTLVAVNNGLPPGPAAQLAVHEDLVFAAYGKEQGHKLFMSRNGGDSWTEISNAEASGVRTIWIDPDGSSILVGAQEGLFSAKVDADPIAWTLEAPDASVWLVAPAPDTPNQFYLAAWDPQARTGRLLRWRRGSEAEEVLPLDDQPGALVVSSHTGSETTVFLLLLNGDVMAIGRDNQVKLIKRYPSLYPYFVGDLALTELDGSSTILLWLGNQSGLFKYEFDPDALS